MAVRNASKRCMTVAMSASLTARAVRSISGRTCPCAPAARRPSRSPRPRVSPPPRAPSRPPPRAPSPPDAPPSAVSSRRAASARRAVSASRASCAAARPASAARAASASRARRSRTRRATSASRSATARSVAARSASSASRARRNLVAARRLGSPGRLRLACLRLARLRLLVLPAPPRPGGLARPLARRRRAGSPRPPPPPRSRLHPRRPRRSPGSEACRPVRRRVPSSAGRRTRATAHRSARRPSPPRPPRRSRPAAPDPIRARSTTAHPTRARARTHRPPIGGHGRRAGVVRRPPRHGVRWARASRRRARRPTWRPGPRSRTPATAARRPVGYPTSGPATSPTASAVDRPRGTRAPSRSRGGTRRRSDPCRPGSPAARGRARRERGRGAPGAVDRVAPRHGVVEHATECVDVGPRTLLPVVALAPVLLQRGVAGGHQGGQVLGPVETPGVARRAEVEQHRRAVLAHEDVGRLDVAVNETVAVNLGQPRARSGPAAPSARTPRGRRAPTGGAREARCRARTP